jgi:hypothetical protein
MTPTSKVIQIAFNSNLILTALCEDGSIWRHSSAFATTWDCCLPAPVNQGPENWQENWQEDRLHRTPTAEQLATTTAFLTTLIRDHPDESHYDRIYKIALIISDNSTERISTKITELAQYLATHHPKVVIDPSSYHDTLNVIIDGFADFFCGVSDLQQIITPSGLESSTPTA